MLYYIVFNNYISCITLYYITLQNICYDLLYGVESPAGKDQSGR